MPIGNRLTNPGRPLRNHYFGGDSDTSREIPPEFRAALDLTVIEIPLPWDQEILPLSDTIIASKAEQKATSEWIRRTTYKPPGPISLVEKITNKDKQVVTRTRNFKFLGDVVGVPGPFTDVQTKNLGNLHFIEEVEDAGAVFANRTSTKEILDVVPEVFRATIPMFENKSTFTAPITIPQILGPNEQYRSETEEDVFNISRTVKGRFGIVYPVIVTEYKMTPDQQVETITNRLALGSQALVPTALMIEGESQDLGDGSSWLRTGLVPDIFDHLEGETSIPDLIPQKFKGILPTRILATTFTGNVDPTPSLGAGELSRKEEQLTEFNMRRTTTSRDAASLPVSLTEYKVTKDKQIETVVSTLAGGLQSLTGLIDELTVEASVENLGNNLSLKQMGRVGVLFAHTEAETSIPDLIPPEFKGILPTQIFASTLAGTVSPIPVLASGDLSRREEQLDVFTMRRTTTSRDPAALPATLTSYKITKDKQISTQTARLATGLQTLTGLIDELTVDAEVINLGNNLSIRKISTVTSLFSNLAGETSIPDLIPPEFRGILPLRLLATTVAGTADSAPTLLTGELSRREEQLDAFTLRRTVNSRDATALPKTLTSSRITRDKQIATVVATLDVGLQDLTGQISELTTEAEVTNLGGNLSLKRIGSVTTLFQAKTSTTEIPDLIPPEFRAILPTHVKEFSVAGTIVDPPILSTGDFEKTETQSDVFTKRVHTRGRDAASLPATLTNLKLTRDKQISTVVGTLDVGMQSLTGLVSELTTEAEVINLGGGMSLKRIGSVPTLFTAKAASTEVPDLVPPEFRAFIPVHVSESNVAGIVVDPPILSTGDLEKTETQTDAFTKRVRTKGRAGVVLPITHFNVELTEEYGGGVVNKIITLDVAGTQTISQGLTVLKSSVTNLGNGTEIKETLQLVDAGWPILTGYSFDKEMQIQFPFEEQVVAPGYTPVTASFVVEVVTPIDKWRSKRRKVTKNPPATGPGSAIVTYSYHPFRFPGLLTLAGAGYYVRASDSQLCRHITRTWWEVSATAPAITVDEIIMDNPIISTLNNTATLAYAGPCIHDDLTTFGTLFWPETTPNYTDYVGTWMGNEKIVAATVDKTDIPNLWKIRTISVVMR